MSVNVATAKKLGIVFLISLTLSLLTIRWHSVDNVPFCHYSAGCAGSAEPRGKITITTYGYPLAYRQLQGFSPKNGNESSPDYAGYAYTRVENPGFSLLSLVMNVVFWCGLLYALSRFIPRKMPLKKPAAPPPAEVPENTPRVSAISHRL